MLNFMYFRIKELSFKDMQCINNMHLNIIIYEGKSPKPLLLKVSLFQLYLSNVKLSSATALVTFTSIAFKAYIYFNAYTPKYPLKITLQIDYYYFFQHWTRSSRHIWKPLNRRRIAIMCSLNGSAKGERVLIHLGLNFTYFFKLPFSMVI